jgi:hypothetical protein
MRWLVLIVPIMSESELEVLRRRVAELEAQCSEQMHRPKIEKMSSEVKDTNPYRFTCF